MPEGPEIVITSQYLKTKLKQKKIESIKILSGRYTHQTLKGLNLAKNHCLTIKTIDSKGKFIWFKMTDNDGNDIYLMNTLGMSGHWTFQKSSNYSNWISKQPSCSGFTNICQKNLNPFSRHLIRILTTLTGGLSKSILMR